MEGEALNLLLPVTLLPGANMMIFVIVMLVTVKIT